MLKRSCLIAMAITFSICSSLETEAATVNGFANGGFELLGTTTPAMGWRIAAEGYSLSTDARTGSFSAQLMSPQLNAAVMLQNSVDDGLLPPLIPGDTPMLSFWAKGFAGTTGNALFALRYLDTNGVILSGSANQFFHTQINPNTWTEITYSQGVVPVGAVSALIEFSQGIGPINGVDLLEGTVLIDDLFLGVSAVPEPGSLAMLIIAGCVVASRYKRQANALHSA